MQWKQICIILVIEANSGRLLVPTSLVNINFLSAKKKKEGRENWGKWAKR